MYTSGEDVLDFRLNFTVTKKKRAGFLNMSTYNQETVILDNVRGRLESGTLTAILGASGCGKTTLLAALSQRLRGGTLSGQIRFNGEVIDRTRMTKMSGFLPQSDVILDGITVREHFYFMIEFKLPNITRMEKQHLIQKSLRKFSLNGDTKLINLSGGEKRRLSLATELLTKPQVLFIDECTSGLDSFSALSVIHTLRDLAGFHNELKLSSPSTSRIVLLSIHQPTSDIFHLFTNIILMNAGRVVFHGTADEAKTLFDSMNKICPTRYNPAEFYVNTISDPRQCLEIVNYVTSKKKEKIYEDYEEEFDEFCTSSSSEMSLDNEKDERLSWLCQCKVIAHRSILNFVRYPNHYLIELLILFIFSLVIMSVYSNISLDSESSVQDIKGFLIILATEILFTFVYAVFTLVYVELPLLRKETGNRLYSLSAYYVTIVLLMIPRIITETFMYAAIIYFATDIGSDFMIFLSIAFSIILAGLCSMAYGFFLSGIFSSFFVGIELSGIVDLVLLLVSGMYTNVKFVPLLKYISFFFYANETVSIIFWSQVDKLKCHPNPEIQCFANGTEVLESMGFGTTEFDIYKDYLYQFILTVVLHVFAFLGVRRNVRRSGFY
ncbi:hypothetical protein ACKWTF_003504 [Chironomus riparius]